MRNLFLVFFVFFCTQSFAGELTATDAEIIKTAGIPLYSSAVFAYGNKDVGFRFASSDPPEKIREWYLQQLAGWTLFEEFGGWILYNGKPGLEMGEVMSHNQVSIQRNDMLAQWHSLDKKLTTEIVVMIVK